MSLWYCEYCDRHVDSNDQDHADYDIMMCEDCVDKFCEDCIDRLEKEQQ